MDTMRILDKLVAFPTISTASNLDLLEWVETFIAPLRPRLRRFPNADGTKANLFASIGPERSGGILLSGHTDVVPTENQAWATDPFRLHVDNQWIIGRGVTDMKGFLAVCLSTLPGMLAQGLSRPVHLALSYDEEVGCTGVASMTDWLATSGLKPSLAVIGEPSHLQVVNAHKGSVAGRIDVTGVPGHSSQPDRGVNAVMAAAAGVSAVEAVGKRMRSAGPRDAAFDPPWSTAQVTMIEGGEARNVLAAKCRFFWEARFLPEINTDMAVSRLRKAIIAAVRARLGMSEDASIDFSMDVYVPALRPEPESVEAPLLALLGQRKACAVPFGSEAGFFQQAGIPSIILGPGDIKDAHQPDERIERTQLEACHSIVERLISHHCRQG